MDAAKIRLSPKERSLVNDAQWILTKNGILSKVNVILAELQQLQTAWLMSRPLLLSQLPGAPEPKISRGDNYKGLPWLMLDHPRYFGKNDMLAVRTFFWWGKYFMVTLLLSGSYQEDYAGVLLRAKTKLSNEDWWIATAADPWEHAPDETNSIRVGALDEPSFGRLLNEHPFVKLSAKIPLSEWDNTIESAFDRFRTILLLLER